MATSILIGALVSLSLVLVSTIPTSSLVLNADPDIYLNASQLIESKGYPVEIHHVVTSDGYILGMQRIPYGLSAASRAATSRPPVLVQHGLLDSSASWVINSASESLGFILADAGFDVWLGNNRGNFYSTAHTTYPLDSKEFWDFNFDQMVTIDLPTMVDYVLQQTNYSSLGYAGHSEGTIQMFGALASLDPSFAKKINVFTALAPVARVGNTESVAMRALADLHIDDLAKLFGFKDFLAPSWWITDIGKAVCGPLPVLCEDIVFLLCGFDPTNLNATRMPVYISHAPAGTSVQNMAHWAQLVRSDKFVKYDYGLIGNMKWYGQLEPPAYDLSKISGVPIGLFTGSNDWLADPKDVMWLIQNLQPGVVVFINNQNTYQHLDFTWGVNAHQLIYPDVVRLLKQYSS